MRLAIDGDLVVGVVSGDAAGIACPADLAQLPHERLRVVAGMLVDAASITSWWIDEMGRKRAVNATGRQALTCPWDAEIERAAGQWTVVPPAERTRRRLVDHAKLRRWQRETGGITWQGLPLATDDRSKTLLAGARIAAQANPDFETTWYGADGAGVVLTAALVIAASDAVLAHVDACFTLYGQALAGINGGQITTTAQIDALFAA